jgi:hypothetical protein
VDLGLGLARRIPAGREGLIGCTSAGVLIARPARTRPTLRRLTSAQQQTASELPGTANGYWSTATSRTTSSHSPSHEVILACFAACPDIDALAG